MARAGEKTGHRNPGVSHGICLGVFPCRDPDPHIEIHRTTAAGGSTAGGVGYDVIGVVDVQAGQRAFQYRDPLPPSNTTFFYRARSVRPEYTASTWTSVVGGMASNLPPGELPYPAVRVLTDATGVQGPYNHGANSSWRAYLLKLSTETFDFGVMYSNTTLALTGSTFILQRQYVTVPFDGVYDMTVAGSYSSFKQSGADEVTLTIEANATTHGTIVDTFVATNISKAYSWAPWSQTASQGAFIVRANKWLAAGTRLSLLANRTFLSSTQTNIEFKADVTFDVSIKW